MACFDSGVARFITAQAVVTVHFPVDFKGREAVCCGQCPYLSASGRTCQLNKAPVQYPDKYVGYDCPLVKEETT